MPIQEVELVSKAKEGVHARTAPLWYRVSDGKQVCGVQLRRRPKGTRCAVGIGLAPNGRCYIHGGAKGVGAPLTAGGRYSEKLRGLREVFEKNLAREGLLDVSPDLALMDTAIGELVEMAEEGDSPGFRQQAAKVYDALLDATRSGDAPAAKAHLAKLGDVLHSGVRTATALADVVSLVDKRAARAHKEREIGVKLRESLDRAAVYAFMGGVAEILLSKLPRDLAQDIIDECGREDLLPGRGRRQRSAPAGRAATVVDRLPGP